MRCGLGFGFCLACLHLTVGCSFLFFPGLRKIFCAGRKFFCALRKFLLAEPAGPPAAAGAGSNTRSIEHTFDRTVVRRGKATLDLTPCLPCYLSDSTRPDTNGVVSDVLLIRYAPTFGLSPADILPYRQSLWANRTAVQKLFLA